MGLALASDFASLLASPRRPAGPSLALPSGNLDAGSFM